jgi:hypothetical protein
MLKESNYDEISINPPVSGMNRNISSEILPREVAYYLENLIPYPLGELNLRYGTSLIYDLDQGINEIIDGFPYVLADGSKQIILYTKKYEYLTDFNNPVILSSGSLKFTSLSYQLFKADTFMRISYQSVNGIFDAILEITNVTNIGGNTIVIDFIYNLLPHNLEDFFVTGATNIPEVGGISYISENSITITVPDNYNASLYYQELQNTRLIINGNPAIDLVISVNGIDTSIPNMITFTFNNNTIPLFAIGDNVSFLYQSLFPSIVSISNSIGFLQVYDFASNSILSGENQTLEGLSLACIPRSEFQGQFGRNVVWIYNGVNDNMVWDGVTFQIYEELVKEFANSFNRIDNNNFSFTSNDNFNIDDYFDGNTISLNINGTNNILTIENCVVVDDIITITTLEAVPIFNGENIIELFYTDTPPPFSFMKSINERLFCLGSGAVGIEYRENGLTVFYSYKTNTNPNGFRFFDENIKQVPSINMASNHNSPDNFETIVGFSGKTAFIGRNETQIWVGDDPRPDSVQSPNIFQWERNLPVGIANGNLYLEMENDVSFITNKGCVSFSTLNIGNQVMVNPLEALDPLIAQYCSSLTSSNLKYRSCRAFKYKSGSFVGFKIGLNKTLIPIYKTSIYSWSIFSGDFLTCSSFLSNLDNSLYLFIDDKIYRYSDGIYSSKNYGDQNGQIAIKFIWTPNLIKKRWANKFIQIYADYVSNFSVNDKNFLSINISSDLRKSSLIEENYIFENKGDQLGSVPLGLGDVATDANGLRLNIPYSFPYSRLKFQGMKFYISIIGKCINGPLSFKNIKLYGIQQR